MTGMTKEVKRGLRSAIWRRAFIGLWVALALALPAAPGHAQPIDIDTLLKQFQEARAAGRHAEALAVAKTMESFARDRVGAEDLSYALALYYQAEMLERLGKDAEAIPLVKRTLEIYERLVGPNDPDLASIHHSLGQLYGRQGKYAEAEESFRRALANREQGLGAEHPDTAAVLGSLGQLYVTQGKYADAERAIDRAYTILKKSRGPDHPDTARTLHNWAVAAFLQGRYFDAARVLSRALQIREKALGPRHPDVAATLAVLAEVYLAQDRLGDAEALYKRTLAILEAGTGVTEDRLAAPLAGLARVYASLRRYAEAETLYKRVLSAREQVGGPDHPAVARTITNLAALYYETGRYAEAERLYLRALAIWEKSGSASHPSVSDLLSNLAALRVDEGKLEEAEDLYKRALVINEAAKGPEHPDTTWTLDALAALQAKAGRIDDAIATSRKASLAAHKLKRCLGTTGLDQQRRDIFRRHIDYIVMAVRQGRPGLELGMEAFGYAQWVTATSAAAALRSTGLRLASGSGELATVLRQGQDLVAAWRMKERALIEALSRTGTGRDEALIATLRREMAEAEAGVNRIQAQLDRDFPTFKTLSSLDSLDAHYVGELLAADEVLVYYLVGEKETIVFARTRDKFMWMPIDLGRDALSAKVAAFRRGLDMAEIAKAVQAGREPELFDLELAHELYATLLGPVKPQLRGKLHLLVVPTGPLTALPFQLLLTQNPRPARSGDDFAPYRDAAWLLWHHAVSVLPSVASLEALRSAPATTRAAKPMIGFGDPDFGTMTSAIARAPAA